MGLCRMEISSEDHWNTRMSFMRSALFFFSPLLHFLSLWHPLAVSQHLLCTCLYSGSEVSHVFLFLSLSTPTSFFTDGISCLHASPSPPPPPGHSRQQWDCLAVWADNGAYALGGREHIRRGPGYRTWVPGALRAGYQCQPRRHCVAGNRGW